MFPHSQNRGTPLPKGGMCSLGPLDFTLVCKLSILLPRFLFTFTWKDTHIYLAYLQSCERKTYLNNTLKKFFLNLFTVPSFATNITLRKPLISFHFTFSCKKNQMNKALCLRRFSFFAFSRFGTNTQVSSSLMSEIEQKRNS